MLAPSEISDHPAGGIVSRGTGHTAAGMGPGTAEVKVCNGDSMLGRFGMRAQAEKLVQVVVSVKIIPQSAMTAVLLFLSLLLVY